MVIYIKYRKSPLMEVFSDADIIVINIAYIFIANDKNSHVRIKLNILFARV